MERNLLKENNLCKYKIMLLVVLNRIEHILQVTVIFRGPRIDILLQLFWLATTVYNGQSGHSPSNADHNFEDSDEVVSFTF